MEGTFEDKTSRRATWVFRYKPSEVLAAAEAKVEHHTKRGEFWAEEHDKAEEELKEKGFEYRERFSSHEPHVQIVGDPELADRVAECRNKIKEHRKMRELSETWVRAVLPVLPLLVTHPQVKEDSMENI